jgi:peptidylprolyl isomerase/FKBP-type peptidyl-prolyl cis-trans isomerase FklB
MRLIPLAAALMALSLPLSACHKTPQVDPAVAAAAAAKTLSDGQAFLEKNKAAPGVVVLPDGVQYRVVTSGPADGNSPRPRDEVKVHYEGKLLNGEVFDSSFERGAPATFPLGGLIPAWVEVMQKMRPGDEWQLWVPASRGYGDQDKGPIPANSVLVFRIQLIDFLPASLPTAQG